MTKLRLNSRLLNTISACARSSLQATVEPKWKQTADEPSGKTCTHDDAAELLPDAGAKPEVAEANAAFVCSEAGPLESAMRSLLSKALPIIVNMSWGLLPGHKALRQTTRPACCIQLEQCIKALNSDHRQIRKVSIAGTWVRDVSGCTCAHHAKLGI